MNILVDSQILAKLEQSSLLQEWLALNNAEGTFIAV